MCLISHPDNHNKMTAKADIQDRRKRLDIRPASVVYATSQLLIGQLQPFFDEDGAAIPEARDDFVVGYVMHMTQLVLTRRQYFAGDAGNENPHIVAKLVLEDLCGSRPRAAAVERAGAGVDAGRARRPTVR